MKNARNFCRYTIISFAIAYPGISKDRQALEEVLSDKSTILAGILDSELNKDFLYEQYGVSD